MNIHIQFMLQKNETILPEGTQVLVYQEETKDTSIINEQFYSKKALKLEKYIISTCQ